VEWFALTLLFGTALYLLRSFAVIAGDPGASDLAVTMARWHVGLTIERVFPVALLVAAIATFLCLRFVSRPVFAVLVPALLFLVALGGVGVDAARHAPDGRLLLQLAAVALGLAGLLVRACRRIASSPARGNGPGRSVLLALSLLAALAVPTAAWAICRRTPPSRSVSERVAEYLSESSSWELVGSNPKFPPSAGFLAPSLDAGIDGAELPSLIMPPPCEIRLRVPEVEGALAFRASAGVDRRFPWQLEHAPDDASVALEILVNGQSRFRATVPARPLENGDAERAWRHAGGEAGLPVAAGDTITLKTTLSPADAPITGLIGLLAGFGNVEIERTDVRPCKPHDREHPNVLLIVMDTLRADELGCYGGAPHATVQATPNLDALAARGVLYERAYATSSWTWPSTASILTGLVPEVHGVLDDTSCYLAAAIETVGEALERAGCATGAFVCNPLIDPVKNFDQGFETFDHAWEARKSEAVLPRIEAWIAERADARFFLYLHLVDPHEPVAPDPQDLARVGVSASPPPGSPTRPAVSARTALLRGEGLTETGAIDPDKVVPKDQQQWLKDTYAAAVSTCDRHVGTVLGWLEEHGLLEDTIVAFTSDHGEELFDHGFLGHDHTLYQELVHVPMILAGPGIASGKRVATPVSNRHLAWTLARRGGAKLTGPADPIDLGTPESVPSRQIHFSTEHGWWWNDHRTTILGVLEWPRVLHVHPDALPFGAAQGTPAGDGIVRLYDLESDPQETKDVAREEPEIVEALKRSLLEHRQVHSARRHPMVPGSGEATKELLRRLGYAGDETDERR